MVATARERTLRAPRTRRVQPLLLPRVVASAEKLVKVTYKGNILLMKRRGSKWSGRAGEGANNKITLSNGSRRDIPQTTCTHSHQRMRLRWPRSTTRKEGGVRRSAAWHHYALSALLGSTGKSAMKITRYANPSIRGPRERELARNLGK